MERHYVVFKLGHVQYGILKANVLSIIKRQGEIPTIDLYDKLNIKPRQDENFSWMICQTLKGMLSFKIGIEHEEKMFETKEIEDPTIAKIGFQNELLDGIGIKGGKLYLLLDINKLIDLENTILK